MQPGSRDPDEIIVQERGSRHGSHRRWLGSLRCLGWQDMWWGKESRCFYSKVGSWRKKEKDKPPTRATGLIKHLSDRSKLLITGE